MTSHDIKEHNCQILNVDDNSAMNQLIKIKLNEEMTKQESNQEAMPGFKKTRVDSYPPPAYQP